MRLKFAVQNVDITTMKPYLNQRFIECPDVADIQSQARASHVGKLPEKSGEFKPYIRSATQRRALRRSLKRQDKQRTSRLDRLFGDD